MEATTAHRGFLYAEGPTVSLGNIKGEKIRLVLIGGAGGGGGGGGWEKRGNGVSRSPNTEAKRAFSIRLQESGGSSPRDEQLQVLVKAVIFRASSVQKSQRVEPRVTQ